MSIVTPHHLTPLQAMTWAAAQPTGSAAAKAVLLFLTWALYDVKRRPLSQAAIAQHAEVSVRAVPAHLETLERLGLIRQMKRPGHRAVIELLASWGEATPAGGLSPRFIGSQAGPSHLLFDWLLERHPEGVSFRDIVKRGPVPVRSTGAANAALLELDELGCVEVIGTRPRHVRLFTATLAARPVELEEAPF